MAWVAFMSFLFFYTMKRLKLLRVDKAIELIGLDIAEMGGLSDEVYEKILRDYGGGVMSPKTSVSDRKIVNPN